MLIAAIFPVALFITGCKKFAIEPAPSDGITLSVIPVTPIPFLNFWRTGADYPGGGRYHAFRFTISGKGYVGAGDNRDFLFPKTDFWSFDPITNVWTQKANAPGGERVGAAAFALNGKGYISTGFTLSDPHLYFGSKSDTWMYDPATNTWTSKAAFPGGARGGAVGMAINGKGYVGTGAFHNNLLTGDTFYRDWWEFDAVANTWTRKADFPGVARCYAAGTAAGNAGYLGSGTNQVFFQGTSYGDWYQYNVTTNTWTLKGAKAFTERNSAVAMTIGKKIYLGTGTTGDPLSGGASLAKKDMAQYDPIANTWTTLTNLPVTRSGAVGFSIGDTLYVGTGFTPQFYALTIY